MTSGRVDELTQQAALCDAATPGPWWVGWQDEDDFWVAFTSDKGEAGGDGLTITSPNDSADREEADAEFIAAARTGWPDAIKALQRVLELCDEYEAVYAPHNPHSYLAAEFRRAVSGDLS